MTTEIECPCCHGMKMLVVYDKETMTILYRATCTHCMGEGTVEVEQE